MYWINGIANHKISLGNRALHFGDGFFTTAKVKNGKIEFLNWHMHRLKLSAKKLMFKDVNFELVHQELKKAAIIGMHGFIKIIVSRENIIEDMRGYRCVNSQVSRIIYVGKLPEYHLRWLQFGVTLQTSVIRLSRNFFLAGIKHLNRLEQVMIAHWICNQHNKIDEALVLDTANNVVECCAANIFWRKRNRVFTPSIRYAGVNGVIRQLILKLLPKLGYIIQEIIVSPVHLQDAEEVFITNSLLPVVSVNTIDNISYQDRTLFNLLSTHLS